MDITFNVEGSKFNYRVAGMWIEDDHILLCQDKGASYWYLPGGRVNLQEESTEALKRELKEELAVDINIDRLVWIIENFFEHDKIQFHEIGLYYKVYSDQKSLKFNGKVFYGPEGDHLSLKWIPIRELASVSVYPEFLKTALLELPDHPQRKVIR